MNRKIALFLALCLVCNGLIVFFPTATAQVYGGNVMTTDISGVFKDYFERDVTVYYTVEATIDGNYLQDSDIDIEIRDPTGNQVHTNIVHTDNVGIAKGEWIFSGGPERDFGYYTIFANFTGDPIGNFTFILYTPVPDLATVVTYANDFRKTGGIPTAYFDSRDFVYYSLYVLDQYQKPYVHKGDIYIDVVHLGDTHRTTGRTTDQDAYIDWFYIIEDNFPLGQRFGYYFIDVTYLGSKSIGNASFTVEDVDIFTTPDKSEYVHGDSITILVETSIDDTIDVLIKDPEGNDLSGANWTDQPIVAGSWTKEYTFSSTLPDGDYEIQVFKGGNLMSTKGVSLRKFNLEIITDVSVYLPGETMKVYYTIINNKDGSGITDASIEWTFEFFDTEDNDMKTHWNEISTPGSQGSFQVSIPKTAYKNTIGHLTVWANDTSDHSDKRERPIEFSDIIASVETTDNEYLAGDFVIAEIHGFVNGANLRNGNVAFNISKDGAEIPAYTVSNLRTDITGQLRYIFVLQSVASEGYYTISINVSKDGTNEYYHTQTNFEVVKEREMWMELSFDKKYGATGVIPVYYSGDSVNVEYHVYQGESVLTGLNCLWAAFYGSNVVAVGTTSSGSFSFSIPSDFEGFITVIVECTDSDGKKVSTAKLIEVKGTGILVNPNTNRYKPDDTISVKYDVVGTEPTGALYYYEIHDGNNNIIKRKNLPSGSGEFKFTIPDGNPPDEYEITVYMTDSRGMEIVNEFVNIYQQQGFQVTFTLDKNTYRPGDTATLHYKIISLDGSEIPEKFTLEYNFNGTSPQFTEVSKSEGDLKLKIPKDVADGEGYIELKANDIPGAPMTTQKADIRESPNPLAETIGDMSLLEILLLIFVIIALIFGIGGWRKGKKALDEAKLPPWKKEGPLPEPEKFKEPEPEPMPEPEPVPEELPIEEPGMPPEDQLMPPEDTTLPPEDPGVERI
jgi:hypothetical protein